MTGWESAWGPILAAARAGDLPDVRIGATVSSVAKEFGGRQPVYLATPYSREAVDDLGAWCYDRSRAMQRAAAHAAAELYRVGVSAFSPIVQSAAMVHATGSFVGDDRSGVRFVASIDPLDSSAWSRWCQPFLNTCGAVVIPEIDGWDRSAGIFAEVRYALQRLLPIYIYGGRT